MLCQVSSFTPSIFIFTKSHSGQSCQCHLHGSTALFPASLSPRDGEKPGLPGAQGVPEQSLWSDQHGFLSVTCWPQPSSNWL